MLVNLFGHFGCDPSKRNSEHHFDGKPVSRSIKIKEREPINSLSQTERSENHAEPNQPQGDAVERTKLQSWFASTEVLLYRHGSP